MFGKNTAVFGIDPTHDSADAARDASRAKGFRSTTPAALPAPDPVPAADFVPDSWPNSGFRNSTRRGTKGR